MMEVQSDEVAGWIVVGERCDCRLRTARPIENSTLALLRHRLSLYRKRAPLGNRYAVNQLSPFREEHESPSSMLCRSDRWRSTVAQRRPWAVGDTDLGSNVLEIGPGPGLTTDLLRTSVPRLVALEIDPTLAGSLSSRLKGSNVQVIEGDATRMPFGDSEFSGAVSFTMLHHVPSRELQNKVLVEVLRVLQPGGFFVGCDSLQNWFLRIIHIGDTLVPVSPDTFGARLESAGFEMLEVQRNSQAFRFRARRPTVSPVKNTNRVN